MTVVTPPNTFHNMYNTLDQGSMQPPLEDPNSLNPYLKRTNNLHIHIMPAFELENKTVLFNVPIAYHTWGNLNPDKNNVLLVCHAFSGSSNISEWWNQLLGPGSPFGSASPVTINPKTGDVYGPEFPITSIRDDCLAFQKVLQFLDIRQIQFVIGGSLGGMHTLEMAALLGPEYVRRTVAIATTSNTSAWCISWNEVQRQCIFTDPNYQKGHYSATKCPKSGLAAARMQALLTYRTRDSFQARFARSTMRHGQVSSINHDTSTANHISLHQLHNEGSDHFTTSTTTTEPKQTGASDGLFCAQSYLRYQGDKFVMRFDANCYIAITRKIDTHDLFRGRGQDLSNYIKQPALILGVESDGLFTFSEQEFLANTLPNAELHVIYSNDGHDAFLLEFEQVRQFIKAYMYQQAPEWFSTHGDLQCAGNGALVNSEEVAPNSLALNGPDFIAW